MHLTIHLNKQNIPYVEHNDLNCTKQDIPWNTSQAFNKRNVQMMSFFLNKHYIDNFNVFKGTKLKVITFTRKTQFQELANNNFKV
jgi:hypothetical protein